MIYISTFTYIKSFIRTQGEGLGAFGVRSFIGRFSMFWIGLVFVFNVWERNLFSEYLQYCHVMCGLVTLGKNPVLDAKCQLCLPPNTFCLSPPYPRVTPVKICGSANGNRALSSRMHRYSSTTLITININ